jgi:hypothetical protein
VSASQDLQRKPSEPNDAPRDVVPLSELLRQQQTPVPEIGGRSDGPDPTRYGDWEKNGRCIDF